MTKDAEDVLRSLPEKFWDVSIWDREGRDYHTGVMDPADRKRIVETLLGFDGQREGDDAA